MNIRRYTQREDGFTLIEMMVTLAVGMVVLTAALKIFTDGMFASAKVQDRAEAAQRARIGFDRINQLLSSQVCNGNAKPIIDARSTAVKFTANLKGLDTTPTGYAIRYNSPNRQLWEERYTLIPSATGGAATWPATPTSRRMIVEDVEPVAGGARNGRIFTYYGENSATGGAPAELSSGSAPMDDGSRGRILRVDTKLVAFPTRTKNVNDRTRTLMETRSYVTSNIVDTALDQGPQC